MEQPPEAQSVTDDVLLRRINDHDDAALGLLFDRYSGLAFAVAYRVLDDHGQAEDVVQEAFLSIWRRAATFDTNRGDARAWLLTVTRNAAIDRRRGRSRHQQRETPIDDHAYRLSTGNETVWSEVQQHLDRDHVKAALQELSPDQRRALELAYFDGLTQNEIAEELNTPLGTVKGRVRLGMRNLEQVLRQSTQVDESRSSE